MSNIIRENHIPTTGELIWESHIETCDKCKAEVNACWIMIQYDNTFLCFTCAYPKSKDNEHG